jgi:hypothetical protein
MVSAQDLASPRGRHRMSIPDLQSPDPTPSPPATLRLEDALSQLVAIIAAELG